MEEKFNSKMDILVSERNKLNRKVSSLQNELNKQRTSSSTSMDISLEVERRQQQEIDRLKQEINEMRKKYESDKTQLLTMVKRLSSAKTAQSTMKQSDVQQLVTNLSALLAEKEDIIRSLKQSKTFLGQRVLELERQQVDKDDAI